MMLPPSDKLNHLAGWVPLILGNINWSWQAKIQCTLWRGLQMAQPEPAGEHIVMNVGEWTWVRIFDTSAPGLGVK